MFYKIKIAGIERSLEMFPVGNDVQIAAFIMFNDTEITIAAAAELLKKAPEYDVIMTAESKGIPLAYEMARQANMPYIVARKKPKLYMKDVIKTDVDSITTTGIQSLCLGADDIALIHGKRVLIVDDVISTGSSLKAIEMLANTAGAEIAAKMAVLAEGDAANREDVIFLEKLPLFNSKGERL